MVDKKTEDDLIQKNAGDESAGGSGRRTLLKTLIAGGAVVAGQEVLPGKWSKPLVESVILPAHAEMSPSDDDALGCPESDNDVNTGDDGDDTGTEQDDPPSGDGAVVDEGLEQDENCEV